MADNKEWKLTINKVENGYILNGCFNGEEESQMVLEENECESGEIMAMYNLLHLVKEYFGINYSKHNQENITIEIEDNTEDLFSKADSE